MSVYMTEQEQLESIKKWWNKYGNWVLGLFTLILISILSYQYLNWRHNQILQESSIAYEKLMHAVSNNDPKAIEAYSNELITEFNRTTYADVARLVLAKQAVQDNDYLKSKKYLQEVALKSKNNILKQIATIRLARLKIENKEYNQTLPTNSVYLPLIKELEGDILKASSEDERAHKAYTEAYNMLQNEGINNTFLEMKRGA